MLPNDIDTEKACLITAIMSKQSLLAVMELLDENDFYHLPYKIIFSNIKELHDKGRSIDLLELKNWLMEKKVYDVVGGINGLSELFTGYGHPHNTKSYIGILKSYSKRRKALYLRDRLTEASNMGMNCDIILDDVEDEIRKIRQEKVSSFETMDEILDNGVEGLHKKGEYFKIGLAGLDNKIVGFFKSNLIVIAGRPSTGKTSLVLNIALNLAKEDKRILFFSIETPSKRLAMRMLAIESEIEMGRILSGHLNNNEMQILSEKSEKLKGLPIMINDDASLGLSSVISIASLEHQKRPLDILIIDYLQLMKSDVKVNRNLGLAEVTAGLKNLSKELDVPVVLLSQLSRAVEVRNPPVPILSDLRDSGGIEQDADLVIFTYESEPNNLIVAKNRDGARGKVPISFEKRYMKFSDVQVSMFDKKQ